MKGGNMLKWILLLATASFVGCTMAGPYVSNISTDGRGQLIIEKCMVEANGLTGAVSNKNCTTTQLILFYPRQDSGRSAP